MAWHVHLTLEKAHQIRFEHEIFFYFHIEGPASCLQVLKLKAGSLCTAVVPSVLVQATSLCEHESGHNTMCLTAEVMQSAGLVSDEPACATMWPLGNLLPSMLCNFIHDVSINSILSFRFACTLCAFGHLTTPSMTVNQLPAMLGMCNSAMCSVLDRPPHVFFHLQGSWQATC